MLLDFLWRLSCFISWIFVYFKIHHSAKPTCYSLNNPAQSKAVKYIPLQMVSLFHASLTVFYGAMYWIGVFGDQSIFDARVASAAYLLFDMMETWRVESEKERFELKTEQRGLQAFKEVNSWKGKRVAVIVNHNPWAKTFHHVCTLLFMYGFGFKYDITGCVLFFVGELPVMLLNINKCYAYLGQSGTDTAMLCDWLGVVTYAVCRVILFPLVFLVVMLPMMDISLFTLAFSACLGLVYLFNLLTFADLLHERRITMPFTFRQIIEFLVEVMVAVTLLAVKPEIPPSKKGIQV